MRAPVADVAAVEEGLLRERGRAGGAVQVDREEVLLLVHLPAGQLRPAGPP